MTINEGNPTMAEIHPQPATDEQKRRDARDRLREFAQVIYPGSTVQFNDEFDLAEDIRLIVQHSDVSERVVLPDYVRVPAEWVSVVADALSQVRHRFPRGILVAPETAQVIALEPEVF